MASLDEKRRQRASFMRALYEQTDGNEQVLKTPIEVADVAGIPHDDLPPLLKYLEGEGLIEVDWLLRGPGSVRLEHLGVLEVEEAIAQPDRPTAHFPPISTINIFGDVNGGQIAVAGHGATQRLSYANTQAADLQQLVELYRRALGEVEPGLRHVVAQQLDQVSNEIEKPAPQPAIVTGLLSSLRAFAESAVAAAGAGAGTAGLHEVLAHWPL